MPGFWRQEDLGGAGWGLSVDPTRARQPVVRGPRDGDKHTGTADQPGGGPEPATRENGGDAENQRLNRSPLRREAGPRVPDTNRARLAGEPRCHSAGLRTPRARRRLSPSESGTARDPRSDRAEGPPRGRRGWCLHVATADWIRPSNTGAAPRRRRRPACREPPADPTEGLIEALTPPGPRWGLEAGVAHMAELRGTGGRVWVDRGVNSKVCE